MVHLNCSITVPATVELIKIEDKFPAPSDLCSTKEKVSECQITVM